MMKRKKSQATYDKENQKPIIHASICTGEQVAGFKDLRTGKFTEIMLIRDQKDLEEFLTEYGLKASEVTKEW